MSEFPGSRWWSFDFHNHTPASSDYNREQRASLTPREWILAYMRQEIDCVAVTDHNCGDWIDRLQTELRLMSEENPKNPDYRDLYIFPGVEITSAEGLHVIAIYSPDDTVAKVHGVLTLSKCDNSENNAESICGEGAVSICENIRNSGGVAILAHAEEKNGIFEGGFNSTTSQYMPKHPHRVVAQVVKNCDGIEVHDLGHSALQHYAGIVDDIALVDGSDAHRSENAGKRSIWVKMASPNIEGLKLALLDPTSSLTRDLARTAVPATRIVSLTVEQLNLRRQALHIPLSPWFNSIIGGRGSGKSTLLESLRLALARSSELDKLSGDSDVRRTFGRFREVGGARGSAGMVRQNTVLNAVVEKRDAGTGGVDQYLFRWAVDSFDVSCKSDSNEWITTGLTEEQATSFFPVRIFSQKQVFELAENPRSLLTYIDSSPEVNYRGWKDRNEILRSQLRALRREIRDLEQTVAKKAEIEVEFSEVLRKTTAYEQSSISQYFQFFKDCQFARDSVDNFIRSIVKPVQNLNSVVIEDNPYNNISLGVSISDNVDSTSVNLAADSMVLILKSQYEKIIEDVKELDKLSKSFENAAEVVAFRASLESGMFDYRQEVAMLRDQGISTAQEAENAFSRKKELEADLAQLADKERRIAAAEKELKRAYMALKNHRIELTERRRDFVETVLARNHKLKIIINGQADVEASEKEFRDVLRIQEGKFSDDIYSNDDDGLSTGLLGRLVATDISRPIHNRVSSLKMGLIDRRQEILGHRVHGRFITAIARLTPDDADNLIEWFPQDEVKIEYRRRENGDFQSLERASAGQKTSAILSFLLAHGDEPLLLDQPEDDLDNALISELVVEQIRSHKTRRQIIVVTHNPNIVVNGDAELVLPLEFAGGQLQVNSSGGLQVRAVRQKICDIMEGGQRAFQQRYRRILEDLRI